MALTRTEAESRFSELVKLIENYGKLRFRVAGNQATLFGTGSRLVFLDVIPVDRARESFGVFATFDSLMQPLRPGEAAPEGPIPQDLSNLFAPAILDKLIAYLQPAASKEFAARRYAFEQELDKAGLSIDRYLSGTLYLKANPAKVMLESSFVDSKQLLTKVTELLMAHDPDKNLFPELRSISIAVAPD